MEKKIEYMAAILEVLLSLFRDQDEDGHPIYHFELEHVDATALFTALTFASAELYKRLTQDDKGALEYTHIANQLVVQELLKDK